MKKKSDHHPFCFVLIPPAKKFLNLWDAAIKPAIEQNRMEAFRGGDIAPDCGAVMGGVRERIVNADMIIAVITDEDPAVMYELGLAHAAKKKVIMMLEKGRQPGKGFSHIRLFSYDPEDLPEVREKLAAWVPSARQTPSFEDFFPELHIRSREDVEEYEYLKQTRKTLTVKVVPENCSIFFNNRFLGPSPQTITVNPDAEKNILSISAAQHFEHYRILDQDDISGGFLRIEMEPRDKEKYPERVNSWLMRRREDPDNPPLSRAIADYLWIQGDYEAARREAEFCVSKAPEWFGGYNVLGIIEYEAGNYDKAKAYFRMVSDLNPDDFLGGYNIACSESIQGNHSAALFELEEIIDSPKLSESYRQIHFRAGENSIDAESAFDPLRNHPEHKERFNGIVKKFDELVFAPEPPLITKLFLDVKQAPTARPLPHTLKQFQIKNFQCISRTGIEEIPIDGPWVFITGENGDGKTSLLQALAIGLHGTADAENLLKGIDRDCKIDTEIQHHGAPCLRHFYWEQDHWKMAISPEGDENGKSSKNVCAYGPSRMDIHAEDTRIEELDSAGPVYNLLRQKGNLRNIERWLKDQKHEAEIKQGDEKFNIKRRMAKVRALLVTLMPHVSDMEIEGPSVFYTEKGHRVPWRHLSAGHKSIIAMIGDLLIRLFEAQPEIVDPKDLEGIVLIDELDAHLHPKWQIKFPGLLSTAFPNAQFIASTHSVIPLMGAPEGSIFLKASRDTLRGTRVEKIDIDMANLLPNAILTSPLFGLESIVSDQNKDFSKVWTDDSFQEIQRQQDRDQRLEECAKKGRRFPREFFDSGDDES